MKKKHFFYYKKDHKNKIKQNWLSYSNINIVQGMMIKMVIKISDNKKDNKNIENKIRK